MIQLSPLRQSAPPPDLQVRSYPGDDPANRLASIAFAAALAAFALLIALPYASMPIPRLLNWVADDGFYYLQIARHIAHGGPSTFDGVTRTNGYHPLWMLCCTALAFVFHDRFVLVHAALWLAFACHAATGMLLARLLKPYTGAFWAKIGGAAWLFNPLALHMCLCLTESPLYILCLVAALIALQDACRAMHRDNDAGGQESETGVSTRLLVRLGLALGAAMLARTDAIFVVVPSLIVVAGVEFTRAPRPTRLRRATRAFTLPALVCGSTMLPWLAYSWASVHALAQDSGVMKSLWQTTWQNEAHISLAARLAAALRFMLGEWLQRAFEVTFQLPFIAPELLIGASGAVAVCAAYTLRRDSVARPLLAGTTLLALATIAMGMAYGYGVSDHQVWHLAEPALAVWLVLLGWVGACAATLLDKRHQTAAALTFLAATAVLGVTGAREFAPHYPWQRDVYRSQPVLEEMVPPGERIGCFNAGIPAYFSDRTIINLDGLVNHDAVPYWQKHRFADYLAAARIGYIIDESDSVNRARAFSDRPLDLTVLASGPLAGWKHPVRYLLQVGSTAGSQASSGKQRR